MKTEPRPILIFLVLSILSLSFARSTIDIRPRSRTPLAVRDSSSPRPYGEQQPDASTLENFVGTKDAPIDGKDGKPHSGPFVGNVAEPARENAKDSADGESVVATWEGPSMDKADVPLTNDGVMDDPNRVGPKDGTRGTEGGVSEKSRETMFRDENIPDPPKEVPPLPHSEQETIKGHPDMDVEGSSEEARMLLEKPANFPDTPHDTPLDEVGSFAKDSTLEQSIDPLVQEVRASTPRLEDGVIQPLHSLLLSFTMILFSEIGDKTFIVAALMAMRHPRTVVFSAAFAAMIVMTVLSAALGHVVPTLIPKSITSFLAATLFLIFGVKMLLEARSMSPDEGVGEEMKEVEMELEEKEHQSQRLSGRRSSVTPYILESGRGGRKSRSTTTRLPSPPESPSSSPSSRGSSPSPMSFWSNASAGFNNLLSLLLSPAWVQTFIMTFLGEWGDRSQIATIAMAAGQDYWWVIAGALGGHFICTGAAVLGGAAVAGKVSLRVVTMGGAIAFLVFGLIYLVEAIY